MQAINARKSIQNDVITRIRLVATRHAECVADLIELLAHAKAIDAAEAHGYPSLFAFCKDELLLSRDQTYRYLACAAVYTLHPQILPILRAGRLSPTGVAVLAGYVKANSIADGAGALARAEGLTVDAIERLVVELAPKPDVPLMIKSVIPAVDPRQAGMFEVSASASASSAPVRSHRQFSSPVPVSTSQPANTDPKARHATGSSATTTPLSPSTYKLTMTLSAETYEQLGELRDLTSHSNPRGELDKVIAQAIAVALEKARKAKRRALSKDGDVEDEIAASSNRLVDQTLPANARRYVSAAVRRAVWSRDNGRCAFVGMNGRRCNSTWQLEIDHVIRVADGGMSTVANARLCCRRHNQAREAAS